jgi:spermidine synthase
MSGAALGEPVEAANAGSWYTETQGEGLKMQFSVDAVVHSAITKFQKVELLQSKTFGRLLMLDGQTQSSQMDEALYEDSFHRCIFVTFCAGTTSRWCSR